MQPTHFFSLPPLSLVLAMALTLYNKVSGDAIIPTSIQNKRSKYMFEFQVNEKSSRSLMSHVLPRRTGRGEVDNEENPGSLWEVNTGWAERWDDFDGCVFPLQS